MCVLHARAGIWCLALYPLEAWSLAEPAVGWQSGSPALPLFPKRGRVMDIYSHAQLFMWLRRPKLRPQARGASAFTSEPFLQPIFNFVVFPLQLLQMVKNITG